MHGERPQAVPLIEPITFWKVMTTHIRLPIIIITPTNGRNWKLVLSLAPGVGVFFVKQIFVNCFHLFFFCHNLCVRVHMCISIVHSVLVCVCAHLHLHCIYIARPKARRYFVTYYILLVFVFVNTTCICICTAGKVVLCHPLYLYLARLAAPTSAIVGAGGVSCGGAYIGREGGAVETKVKTTSRGSYYKEIPFSTYLRVK